MRDPAGKPPDRLHLLRLGQLLLEAFPLGDVHGHAHNAFDVPVRAEKRPVKRIEHQDPVRDLEVDRLAGEGPPDRGCAFRQVFIELERRTSHHLSRLEPDARQRLPIRKREDPLPVGREDDHGGSPDDG